VSGWLSDTSDLNMIGANFGLKIGTRAESEEHSGYRTKNMA